MKEKIIINIESNASELNRLFLLLNFLKQIEKKFKLDKRDVRKDLDYLVYIVYL